MKTNIFPHPNTVTGIDAESGVIATSCFDGYVRVIGTSGNLIFSEKRGSQIHAVAIRNGLTATDTDTWIGKEGVAITEAGDVIRHEAFAIPAPAHITAISRNGRYGVGTDLKCYDRIAGMSWVCVPSGNTNHTPMAVQVMPDGKIAIVSLDGFIRVWFGSVLFAARQITPAGLSALDVSSDGTRFIVGGWDRVIRLLDASNTLFTELVQTTVFSAPNAVRFYDNTSALIGTANYGYGGELFQWDLQPDAVTTTTEPVAKVKGKK